MELKTSPVVLVLTVLLLSTTLAGCLEPDPDMDEVRVQEYHRTLQTTSQTSLVVRGINGGINVVGWDGDNISLTSTKVSYGGPSQLDRVEVSVTEGPDRILVEERHHGRVRDVSVTLTLHVPRDLALQEVSTTNGDITLEGLSSVMTVSTYNGEIRLDNVRGSVEASTSNGGLKAVVSSLDGDMTLSSGNGGISVHLEPSMDADLTATTGNGWVSIHDLPLKTSYESIKRLDGRLGRGGHLIRCETSNGAVDLFPL